MSIGARRGLASPRGEESGRTRSSRGLVRHPEERESAQGVMGPARVRDALSIHESCKAKNGSEGIVYEGQECQQPRDGM